jgi:hypothetical protein
MAYSVTVALCTARNDNIQDNKYSEETLHYICFLVYKQRQKTKFLTSLQKKLTHA